MRVLLADGQMWLRSAMRWLLENQPNIEVVGEARDAHSLVREIKTSLPNLILLDWELPGFRALSERKRLVNLLHTEHPSLRIIALSVNSDVQVASTAIGIDAFVNKADPPEHLLTLLAQIEQTHYHHLPSDGHQIIDKCTT